MEMIFMLGIFLGKVLFGVELRMRVACSRKERAGYVH